MAQDKKVSVLTETYQKNMPDGMYNCLSRELDGVSVKALKSIGWGFAPVIFFEKKDKPSTCGWWTYPERDAKGDIVAIGLRARDGKGKYMHPWGTSRGLIYAV